MPGVTEILTAVVILGAVGVSAWLMNMFFGLVGVGLLVLFTILTLGVMYLALSYTGNASARRT